MYVLKYKYICIYVNINFATFVNLLIFVLLLILYELFILIIKNNNYIYLYFICTLLYIYKTIIRKVEYF